MAYWYLWGRRVYVGPRVNVELVDGVEPKISEDDAEPVTSEMTGEKKE